MKAKNRIIPVFVPHLGCPNHCVFCNQCKISGAVQPVTPAEVDSALSAAGYVSDHGELAFYGGSFTAIPEYRQRILLEAAQPYRQCGFLTAIRVSTRPDAISREKLSLLRYYGVETIELGAQSMDDSVLRISGRGHTAEDTRRASSLIREEGFRLILQMMTGLPGSDPERDYQTAEELRNLRPDGVRIYPTVILRDTPLERLWRSGEYRAHTVMDAIQTCTPIVELFQKSGIPILRLGLNPTEALSGGEAVAGAYHPALGEMVYSRIWLQKAQQAIRKARLTSRRIRVIVPVNRISMMTGAHQCNLLALRFQFGLEEVSVCGEAIPADTVAIREIM